MCSKASEDKNYIDVLSKDSFREMFTVTKTESFILRDNEYYRQHDGVKISIKLKNSKIT